jgi:hypothetical protein
MSKYYNYEGQVEFAQKQFDAAREYKQTQADKYNNLTKKLLEFDAGFSLINPLINNAAEEMDARQLPKKAAYQNLLDRSTSIRNDEAARVQAGTSVVDFLENKYFTQLDSQAATDYGYLSPIQYRKALREEARKMAIENAPEYKQVVASANNIPDFKDFDNYYKNAADTPRNLAEWAGKQVKRFFVKENEETLKIKNERADDALYGTALFDKFGDFATSLKTYETVSGQGIDAAKIIEGLELKTGGALKQFTKELTPITKEDETKGIKITEYRTAIATARPDGTPEYLPENIHTVFKTVNITNSNRMDDADINSLYKMTDNKYDNTIADILSNPDGGRPTFEQGQKAREFLANNPKAYAINWSDEKAKLDSFPEWYSIQIKYERDPTSGKRIAQEVGVGTGVYEIKEDYRDVAEKLDLDEPTMLSRYNNLGATIAGPAMSASEIDTQGKQDFITLLKDPQSKKAYQELLENQDSDLYDLLNQRKIENSETDIVPLGIWNLEVVFPNLNITGKKQIFWDRVNNQLMY